MRSSRPDLAEGTGVEDPVCEFARGRGWLVRKIAYIGRRGGPDRMFIRSGRIVLVEFKKPGRTPGAQQRREIRRLRNHGAEVYVIDNAEDGYDILA